ncbi:hypothetical protein L861_22780 [Litchfieldella anticariensis FP35 = DSM 16096]|uniref:Major facilitator superfamily (MFS) profile domain-containing protein n=1 Tax=Litchfieldella anticariensis (strain DSM 16096 / CECT 5854 / CIP 108499 / LMG 22089 / FP35) TaxID=1121939 RepID=S2KRL3_LITA3|nr:MFS transporter [Halomonas anticariensis]EPC03138.1 hypothetical protein L861_22780 [Halomonas anticariensis FP35 = DSM 16096]
METATSTPDKSFASAWFAVVAVATGIFSLVTTEILPIGLLTSISVSLGVSDGMTGLAVTMPGAVAAVSAPLVTMAAGTMNRRHLLCLLMTLLLVANVVSALATSFVMLLAARVLVGVCIGGFWAVAAGLGVRLVDERFVGRATAIIFGGVAVASVVGVPAGTLVGDLFSWRVALAALAALNATVFVALVCFLPPLPANQRITLSSLFLPFRIAGVRVALLATLLVVAGHFTAFTFVRPFLEQVTNNVGNTMGALLLLFGVCGVVGNFLAGSWASRSSNRTLLAIVAVMALTMLGMPLIGVSLSGAAVMLALWGLAYGGLAVTLQTHILQTAPHTTEAATALFVAIFNLSIALGSLLGGRTVDVLTSSGVMTLGGCLALSMLVMPWLLRAKQEHFLNHFYR